MRNLQLSIPDAPKYQLPTVCGWAMLIQPINIESSTSTGLVLTEDSKSQFEQLLSLGRVLKQGPLCYKEDRLGETPWCKEGDLVVFSKNGGFRYNLHGEEFILLNDDRIIMVVTEDMLKDMNFEIKISHELEKK